MSAQARVDGYAPPQTQSKCVALLIMLNPHIWWFFTLCPPKEIYSKGGTMKAFQFAH